MYVLELLKLTAERVRYDEYLATAAVLLPNTRALFMLLLGDIVAVYHPAPKNSSLFDANI